PEGRAPVAGFCQVAPPSPLRQMPPPFVVLLSSHADAMRTWGLRGENLTSDMRNGRSESIWDQLKPESVVLKRPPLSDAATPIVVSVELTSTATVRLPHLIFG